MLAGSSDAISPMFSVVEGFSFEPKDGGGEESSCMCAGTRGC